MSAAPTHQVDDWQIVVFLGGVGFREGSPTIGCVVPAVLLHRPFGRGTVLELVDPPSSCTALQCEVFE